MGDSDKVDVEHDVGNSPGELRAIGCASTNGKAIMWKICGVGQRQASLIDLQSPLSMYVLLASIYDSLQMSKRIVRPASGSHAGLRSRLVSEVFCHADLLTF